MKNLSLIAIVFILLTTSCYKDNDPAISSSGSNPTNPATCNFAPYRTGSKMTQTANSTGATTDFEVTKDTTIGSDKYYVFVNKTSNISGLYIRVDGSGNVWQYTPALSTSGQSFPSTNFIYLKPNESINTEWSYPGSSGSTYVFKIVEKNLSKTINGVSYTNGIKVNLKINYTVGGSTTSISDADYLWFCGFGYYSLTQSGTEVSKVTSFIY
jgi:hypothetical protein